MKAYTPPPTYVRLPPVQSGESAAMTSNRDINLYNDNGTLKQNIAGVTSTVGGSSYDQDLNTTDSPTFVVTSTAVTLPANEAVGAKLKFTPGGAATTSPQDGDVQYSDGTLLRFTTATGTGVVPSLFYNVLSTSNILSTGNALQHIFPSGRRTLTLGAGAYFFDFHLFLYLESTGGISKYIKFETTNCSAIAWTADTVQCNTGIFVQQQNAYSSTVNEEAILIDSTGSFPYHFIHGSGRFQMSSTGTFSVKISGSFAGFSGTPLAFSPTFVRIQPMGTAGTMYQGPWS